MIKLSKNNEFNKSQIGKKDDAQHKQSTPDLADMLLSKKDEKVIDSETIILETQKRVWAALKTGYEYSGITNEAENFLRKNVFSKMDMIVLYVDLVGSTTMALELPEDKLAIIISSFSQEMASVISLYGGYVLKFVGDAVIGFFLVSENPLTVADKAVSCAKSMIATIQKGINPILNQYDYPDLMVKIGVDFGQSIVVRYGSNPEQSHVDLMGPAMNIAAKIQSLARPNQILVGDDVYRKLHPVSQSSFKEIVWKNNEWKYRSRVTGEIYKVYEHVI
ncbi:MAG: Adenylate/guanylate cyclase [Nitrosarchaeum sp.]|nr:Adenylate/guanylate cyclase [Nitrosarchaeum sp.]